MDMHVDMLYTRYSYYIDNFILSMISLSHKEYIDNVLTIKDIIGKMNIFVISNSEHRINIWTIQDNKKR